RLRPAQGAPELTQGGARKAGRLAEHRQTLAAFVAHDLGAGHRLDPGEVGDLLGDLAAEALFGGVDGRLQAVVGTLLDGRAVALAPLDELQRLARQPVLPVLL